MEKNQFKTGRGVLSDLYDDCQLLIAPGDVADKLTILSIKTQIIEGLQRLQFIHDELQRTLVLMDRIIEYNPDIDQQELKKLIQKLKEINREQWKAEDRVRTENSWEAAKYARECNTRRVAVKNEINELFKYPIEQKEYKNQ